MVSFSVSYNLRIKGELTFLSHENLQKMPEEFIIFTVLNICLNTKERQKMGLLMSFSI